MFQFGEINFFFYEDRSSSTLGIPIIEYAVVILQDERRICFFTPSFCKAEDINIKVLGELLDVLLFCICGIYVNETTFKAGILGYVQGSSF